MTGLSPYVLETLRDDGELGLYRGRREGERSPVLIVAPVSNHLAPVRLERLEHEYALRAELDAAWAARPLALLRHEGRPMLLLEDPGGEPLDRLLGQPWEVTRFLRYAIRLSAALGRVHERGLVHKDVKPANILVDPTTGDVRLTGFGIASRLPRERQPPEPPEVIAGTLAYMAPEQTGRMNRSIDSRSDLYSLGVTLYEILTGALPFTATDPMEWIHCHTARQPVPPAERAEGVPGPVSDIVVKLLAKTAEERYQTAAGVEADLRRCLTAWESVGRIDPFPLGTKDASDRLLIPERLYGREPELQTLLAAFDRVIAHGTPELVLVSGYSGIGKSSVVNELHKVLVPPRGLFAAGKFDQYKRDIPYSTLAQAFQSLIRPLLGKSDAELAGWRDALREALGPSGRLIADLVPELTLIIGDQPPVPELRPQDARRRFQLVFRRFIGVFARPEHPLALFLDDLQWLDTATLDLLEDLLTQPDVRHLLLIGAYRDNEVDAAHPLRRTLAAIRQAGAVVRAISLAPLAPEDLGRLIADSLRCEPAHTTELAHLVHEKTAGNPFFAVQFLSALAEERLLTFDHGDARWTWNLDRIHAKGYTDNVVDLMVGKLTRLPTETQVALQQLACLGNVADIATLSIVRGTSEEQVHSDLWEAARLELIVRLEGVYRFVHDRVQEAAYSLIPADLCAAAHLRIGRLLAARTPPEKREEAIFEIVNQLNRGAALITAPDEREQLAELNLIAGRRAKASAAYATALTYLTAGAALLAEDGWARQHELAFSLEINRAECEFLTGELVAAEQRLAALSARATDAVEQASVACLRVDLYVTLDQSGRAAAVGLDYLRHLGIEWSPHPTAEDARREYQRIWSTLGDRRIEALVELPLMSDPASLATLDVLAKLALPALYTDANLVSLVICRVVNLSLEGGNCDGSCFAYEWLGGMIAGPRFGDYKAGFRFGRLGYELVEQHGLKRFQARTYMNFGNVVMPWTRHVRAGRELVRRAFEAANQSGDLNFAAYCCSHLNTNLLAAGDPLLELQGEAERGLAFAQKMRFGLAIDRITTQLGLIRTLRGLTPTFGCFDDEQFDERRIERRFSENPDLAFAECWYWVRKLQARYFAGDYAAAVDASLRAQRLLWTSVSHFETAEYHFYGALSRAASCDSAAADRRQQHVQALVAHHRQLEIWAANCPENFENRAALVGAEIARIEGRALDAMDLYEQAVRSAQANGFVHNEALANELAARFYAARGFETSAQAYLRNARSCYLRWGAEGKVRQLDRAHPQLRDEAARSPLNGTIGTSVAQLDAETVVKASQAVSSEIVLEKLIETLMVIAVEHAGAERGLLILPRREDYQIEAEATTRHDTVEVALGRRPVAPFELAASVLQYVLRTCESVILDDAATEPRFSDDEYVRRRRPRSVLCLPFVKQATLVGVLYLENNLTPRAFTPDRLAVLELLASQAAISFDNARLYADLRRSEGYLADGQRLSRTGSWGWNVATGALYWSREHFRIFGFDAAKTQPSYSMFLERIHPEDRSRVEQTIDRAVRERHDFEMEYRIVLPGGATKYVRSLGHPVPDDAGGIAEIIGTVMDMTEQKRAGRALRRARERALQARFAATLEERTRLAREIHDTLLQGFTGVSLKLVAAMGRVTGPPATVEALRDVLSVAQKTLEDARRAVWDMRSPALAEGDFPAALQAATERAVAGTALALDYAVQGTPRALAPEAEAVVFRVAQEAIANAVKHAAADTLRVALAYRPRGVRLAVTDDGRGFSVDPDFRAYAGHWGLLGMHERAMQLHAKLSVQSAVGAGTSIVLRVPYGPGGRRELAPSPARR